MARNATTKLTTAQDFVVDRLKRGWHIYAPNAESMTRWLLPNHQKTLDACPHPTLKALEKKGVVCYNAVVNEWQLAAPRATAEATEAQTLAIIEEFSNPHITPSSHKPSFFDAQPVPIDAQPATPSAPVIGAADWLTVHDARSGDGNVYIHMGFSMDDKYQGISITRADATSPVLIGWNDCTYRSVEFAARFAVALQRAVTVATALRDSGGEA